jgi:hypothetical protein
MKSIPLSHGMVALVDDADYEALSRFKWHAANVNGIYCARTCRVVGGKQVFTTMHRLIMDARVGCEVHHASDDHLDNRRSNLELLTPKQVRALRVRPRRAIVPGLCRTYKPPNCRKDGGVRVGGKKGFSVRIYIGTFPVLAEAARVYGQAVEILVASGVFAEREIAESKS